MENSAILKELTLDEALVCNGGGFAYDVGCVLGFLVRVAENPYGYADAIAIWNYQHSK